MLFEAYFGGDQSELADLRQAIITAKIHDIFTALQIKSNDESLISNLTIHLDKQPSAQFKVFLKVINDALLSLRGLEEKLSQEFLDFQVKAAKTLKSSSLLSEFLYQLGYENIKEHLPLIVY
jgi:hypothetical protein